MVNFLCLWAFIGFFAGSWTRHNKPATKRAALWQTFYLGPLFWIGVPLFGLIFFRRYNG